MSTHDERQPSKVVKERGHWQVDIRLLPASGAEPLAKRSTSLLALMEAVQVRLRGWYLPHVNPEAISNSARYIEGGSAWGRYQERWRLYTDGQFLWEQGLRDDWNDAHEFDRSPSHPDKLNVVDAVYTLTELYRFASRLAKAWDGTAGVHMAISVHGTKDRLLWINDPERDGLHAENRTQDESITVVNADYRLLDLIETSDVAALSAATTLFRAFGWEPHPGVLESMQRQLLFRR